ncbi:transporter, UIT6 family [Thermanaeromonas toyohensis ToBE]|uniref:Transporter, UIT6 family n=1 Tax=Thermanaeromonas toyohensis ToBE TaxID=698762 RepID=A0A1W1V722_9FIRM|nr:sodium:proton antiporter [Thermanaeromonas toyohensis]SMB89152.1 transporter, UIT6 family [Thermanaeromonas toyohensis ToBE]
MYRWVAVLLGMGFLAFILAQDAAWASETVELGYLLPLWSVLPFVGMLLSIAICPLVNSHWWEHNMGRVSAFWALVFFIPFLIAFGPKTAFLKAIEVYLLDYLPFIILLFGLFVVSGGLILRGTLRGTPTVNTVLLLLGTLLASWIGTTGASMLMIRPVIRANEWRRYKAHIIIFFIFLVSNIGGALTPLGDPPLFLGFLRGVPFFWTMRLIVPMGFNVVILLALYYCLDTYYYGKENVPVDASKNLSLRVEGLKNLFYLGLIVGAVILSGFLAKHPAFADLKTGELYGLPVLKIGEETIVLPYINIIRDLSILLAAYLSLKTTPQIIRRDNRFTWGPIKEVATLFAGIFMTMIPALAILHARGAELGLTKPAHFFWATGALSSFLDNAPTYLVFLTTATSLGATAGVPTTLGLVDPRMLMAVSCGAVFMGANTYIGNAPNFMVRSIAEENKIRMPSFFGYMGWSLAILIPLFILDTLIFFR